MGLKVLEVASMARQLERGREAYHSRNSVSQHTKERTGHRPTPHHILQLVDWGRGGAFADKIAHIEVIGEKL